jgi:KAP family P-loop domain/CHAT domain
MTAVDPQGEPVSAPQGEPVSVPPDEPPSFDAAVTRPDEDLLGIHPYAARLAEFIDKLHPPFTIGVYGAWGSGKTTFVRLMESELRELHGDLKFIVVEAWQFKTSDDLWRRLVQQIAYAIHGVTEPAKTQKSEPPAESFATRQGRRLREPAIRFRRDPEPPPPFAEYYDLLQRLDDTRYGGARSKAPGQLLDEEGAVTALVQGTVAALGNLSPMVAAMRAFFGFDSKVDVAKLLQQEKNETTRNRIQSVEDFRKAVEELFKRRGTDGKVCVFIDDLDRCMPEVALDLLEALKIFLGDTRCIFIVAVDERMIGEGLRIRYKELLALPRADMESPLFPRIGKEYFEKIIQLAIRVPQHTAPNVHRFIAAQFPQWLASTDLIQTAVGRNPRRLKQYCMLLDYKYMVARDPKDADDWPLLTKLVELGSRSADAAETLRELAREPDFAKQMKSIETFSRDKPTNPIALKLHDLAAGNASIRKVIEAQPPFSLADAAELAAVAGFVDTVPDTESTRMLKSRDGVLIRLFEKVSRTGAPTEAELLDDDLLKLDELVKLDPRLDAILRQLAHRDDWSDVMDSVESSLQGGANARRPNDAAAPLLAIARTNEDVRKKLLEPQLLSTVLPQIVRHRTPRSEAMPPDEVARIKAALAVRLRAARHFVNRRKFVKLDALGHSWPDLFQYVQTDKSGLRTFEANVTDPSQRTQDLPERWQPYVRDEKLMAFLHLRPFLADILDEDVSAIAGLTASVVRPSEAVSPVSAPGPAVVQTSQPVPVPPPATLRDAVVPPGNAERWRAVATAAEAAGPKSFTNTTIQIFQLGGEYHVQLHGERGSEEARKLVFNVAELRELAENLREFVRTHRQDIAGRLREFGTELYQLFFARTALDEFLMAPSPRRFSLSVPPELQFLPWELLYVPSSRLFLGLSPHHSLVRFVKPPQDRRSLGPVEPPLRILAFLGKAGESLPRLREEEGLLSQLSGSLHVTLHVLSGDRATFSELEKTVKVLQPHVLHFSGYRDATDVLFPDTRMTHPVFIDWLANSRVRLVDLTGCYVPPGGLEDTPSFASDLAGSGVPMVINTTSPITSEAVLVFTRDFYRTLAEGRSIEEALVDARQSQSKEQWDWSAFALYSSEPALDDPIRGAP